MVTKCRFYEKESHKYKVKITFFNKIDFLPP